MGYRLVAQTSTHKTTLDFYEYADAFEDFAMKLRAFPFVDKKDVVYKLGYYDDSPWKLLLLLQVRLIDGVGRVSFRVFTDDQDNIPHSIAGQVGARLTV